MKNETGLGQECPCIPLLQRLKTGALVLGQDGERHRERMARKDIDEWGRDMTKHRVKKKDF